VIGKAFVANKLDVCLHEMIVVAPIDTTCEHGGLLNTCRNLMRMEVVEIELVDHRFLHFFTTGGSSEAAFFILLIC
jgi:hypothetical protein